MNIYIQKIDDTRKVPENYKQSPLPIFQRSQIVLVDSKAERKIVVTVQPGVSSVRLQPPRKAPCETTRYKFAYIVHNYVKERFEVVAERVGHWVFTPGQGLSVETDPNHMDEVNRVMGEALCGVYGLAALIMAHSDPSTRKVTLPPQGKQA